MGSERELPAALKVVAVLFIVGGVLAVVEVIVAFAHGRISINFGVLGLFIGPGLLALSQGWRTCAVVLLWIAMIVIPLVALFMLIAPGPADLRVLGQSVRRVPKPVALAFAAFGFWLAWWQYRVLTRPAVRALFGLQRPPGGPEDQG